MPHKLETPTHRIAAELATRQAYMNQHRGRKCKEKCESCGQKWAEIDSIFVHLATERATGKQSYWCDGCLKINAQSKSK